jgi:hypothetical protein
MQQEALAFAYFIIRYTRTRNPNARTSIEFWTRAVEWPLAHGVGNAPLPLARQKRFLRILDKKRRITTLAIYGQELAGAGGGGGGGGGGRPTGPPLEDHPVRPREHPKQTHQVIQDPHQVEGVNDHVDQ